MGIGETSQQEVLDRLYAMHQKLGNAVSQKLAEKRAEEV
jgi:hypothetical protein